MPSDNDKKIAEILGAYGEPMEGSVWRVQGAAVIYHKTLERIAAYAQIVFGPPEIVRAERDEAVIIVTGEMRLGNDGGTRREWSIGEALIGVNYRVSGKQAAYVFAMAEKRAKDRVILKLIGLHGLLYSEEEADEFKATREIRQQTSRDAGEASNASGNGSQERGVPPSNPGRPPAGSVEWREALYARARAKALLGSDALNAWWSQQSGSAQAALEEINSELDAIVDRAFERREAAE